MARPEAVRRVKSYSAATGYVYQYYFFEVQKKRHSLAPGTEYVYMVSIDRKKVFPVRILVRADAADSRHRKTGLFLTGTEEYALAKLRLFQALDELTDLDRNHPELFVDQSNIESLLAQLDL